MDLSLNNSPYKATQPVSGFTCPKCGGFNRWNAGECGRCGVIFSKLEEQKVEGEIEFRGSRELAQMWRQVLANYDESSIHDQFLQNCLKENCLAYASHKYRMILEASPSEEIAHKMRRRILNLATAKIEIDRPTINVRRAWSVSNMFLLLSSTLILMGFLMPTLRNLVGVGAALLVLVVGLRFIERSVY